MISFYLTGNSGHIIMCRRKFFLYITSLRVSQSVTFSSFLLPLFADCELSRPSSRFISIVPWWLVWDCCRLVLSSPLNIPRLLIFFLVSSHRLFRSSFFLVVCVTLWVLSPSLQSRHSFHLSFILATLLTVPTWLTGSLGDAPVTRLGWRERKEGRDR